MSTPTQQTPPPPAQDGLPAKEPKDTIFMGDNLGPYVSQIRPQLWHHYFEPNPMPKHVPPVQELGVTSAPLKSASFHMGKYCKDYNDDFMLCRGESQDPEHCLKEGRRVTRCATDFITQMRENCGMVFAAHWQCLERRNQKLRKCRNAERRMNACVEEKMGLKKEVPGMQGVPVFLREDKDLYWKAFEA